MAEQAARADVSAATVPDADIVDTTTAIVAAPTRVAAFTPFTMTAQVTPSRQSNLGDPKGLVLLYADDVAVDAATLSSSGETSFVDTIIPWGTSSLTVRYVGDPEKPVRGSDSAERQIEVTAVPTTTELSFSKNDLLAGDGTEIHARVTNGDIDGVPGPDTLADPRGEVLLWVDDEVIGRIPVGMDVDAEFDDAEAVFMLRTADLPVGSHRVVAEFVPADGWVGSHSNEAGLKVAQWKAQLSAKRKGSDIIAMTVQAQTDRTTELQAPEVDGEAQLYSVASSGAAPIGETTPVVGGRAELPLPAAGAGEVELRFSSNNPEVADARLRIDLADADTDGPGSSTDPGSPKESPQPAKPIDGLDRTGTGDLVPLWWAAALILAGAAVGLRSLRRR